MKERELLPPVSPVTFMLLLCLLELSPLVGRKEREFPHFFHQLTCCKQQEIGEDVLDELATESTASKVNVYIVVFKLVQNSQSLR